MADDEKVWRAKMEAIVASWREFIADMNTRRRNVDGSSPKHPQWYMGVMYGLEKAIDDLQSLLKQNAPASESPLPENKTPPPDASPPTG